MVENHPFEPWLPENALLTYRQAKEQVASSKENVQRAQTNLGYATITSPIDGTVISKSVEGE